MAPAVKRLWKGESRAMEEQFVSVEVRTRRGRDTERCSHIVSGWSKVDKDLSFFLEKLKEGSSLDPQLRDDICTVKLMMKLLISLLGNISMLQTGDLVSKHSLNSMASVLESVIQELEAFGGESLHSSRAGDLNSYSNTAARIVTSSLVCLRNMKPEMRKLLFVISGSSKPLTAGAAAQLVSFINLLLEILIDMSCFRDDLIGFLKEQIEALQIQLIFLRNVIGFLSGICFSNRFLIDLLSFAGAQAVTVACILYFILVDEISEDRAQKIKTKLLFEVEKKIKPLSQNDVKRRIYVKVLEDSRSTIRDPIVIGVYALGFFDSLIHNLREVSNKRIYLEVALEELTESLFERLRSVRCYIEEIPSENYEEGLENFRTQLLDLIIDLGCFVCGLESKEKLGNLLDKIQFIESASGDLLIPRSWQYNFPKTNELGFVDFILVNLWERLNCSMISPDLWNCSIDTVYEQLVSLRHDFGEIARLCKENEEFRSLLIHYKDVTYQAEYLFDLSLSATEFSAYQRLGLTGLMESIRQISRKLKAITVEMTSDNLVHNILDSVNCLSPEANPASIIAAKRSKNEAVNHIDNDQLVGLEYDIEKIKWQLMRGSKQLQILSIVGMPGIGKTTLAKSVYEDPAVTMHFHAHVWCSVSQAYQKENLLNEILHQVQRETKHDLEDNDEGFDLQVYQGLKGRRYLVILDDIWEAKVWADLELCFPNDSNGSRVVFTTRNQDVATQANSEPHALQLLPEDESWKLLRVKVFKDETCPVELSQVGKKIVKDCGGLPLAIVLIAGVLKTTERKQDCWARVAEKLRTYVLDYASGEQSGAIELSYVHLPDYLKACFLYFGAFPEDREIPVRKLVHLWVAEGFVQQPKGDQISPEYVAENYLNSLIRRSLVIIAKRSSRGGVKACRIHDLLRDFCLVKSEEERFLLQIKRYDDFPAFRISEMHEQYRLCIDSPSIPSVRMGHFESRVRTLFLSRWRNFSPGSFSRTGYHAYLKGIDVLDKFRLLRVLDLGKVTIRDEKDFVTITRGLSI